MYQKGDKRSTSREGLVGMYELGSGYRTPLPPTRTPHAFQTVGLCSYDGAKEKRLKDPKKCSSPINLRSRTIARAAPVRFFHKKYIRKI